jgi:hypothetical protein
MKSDQQNRNRLRFGPHFVAELNSERGLGLAYTHHFWWFGVDEDLTVAKEVRRTFLRYEQIELAELTFKVSGEGRSIVLPNGVKFSVYDATGSRTQIVYSVPGLKPVILDASFPGADFERALWALARKYPDKVTS